MRSAPAWAALLAAMGLALPALPARAQAPLPAPAGAPSLQSSSVAAVVWNREIVHFRAEAGGLSPAERAQLATRRILDIPAGLREYQVETNPATFDSMTGYWILANGILMFGLYEEDLDPESGETIASAAERAAANLRAFLVSREEQHRWPDVLRGVAWSVAATLTTLLLLSFVLRVYRRQRARIEKSASDTSRALWLGKIDVRPHLYVVGFGLLRAAAWGAAAAVVYLWLTIVLQQFPYTRPWGQQLGGFVTGVLQNLGLTIVQSIPNLFIVLVIFLGTRLLSKVVYAFFHSAEAQWMEIEIARATGRLAIALLWIFALVVAYPYLPGSGTAAFQGISVLLGLMVSLGATGIVSQLLGGLVVVYTRAFRGGEYVRIGEHEGTVTGIGALAVKILTRRKEEITIPHSVLVGSATTNFSRQAVESGAIVATTVAVGYDVPWRQVEALLIEACRRTQAVLGEAPRVLKSGLGSFAVEYTLLFRIAQARDRYEVLSLVHANILDAFNEHGVQIMTPAFEGQPDNRVVVPRSRWFEPPATKDEPGRPGMPGDPREPRS
jgi:small-conductance mechanosensitive channel